MTPYTIIQRFFLSIVVLLALHSGLYASDDAFRKLTSNRLFISQSVNFSHFDKFFEDQQGRIWGCSFSGALAMWDGVAFVQKAKAPGRIFCFHKYDDRQYLIGTEMGLVLFDTYSFDLVTIDAVPTAVNWIAENDHGELVIISTHQAYRGSKQDLSFGQACSWNNIYVSAAIPCAKDRFLLLSRYKGIWEYDSTVNQVRDLGITGIDPKKDVQLDLIITGDSLWVATDRGAYHGQLRQGATLIPERELQGLTAKCFLKSSNGDFWIGTDKGLYVRENGRNDWSLYQHKKFGHTTLFNDCVWGLKEDSYGNIWIGVESGVSQFSDFNEYGFLDWTFDQGTKGNHISCILTDSKDRIWLGGSSGLAMHDMKNGETILFDKMDVHSCIDNRIWYLYEDRQGIVWICTDESVAFYDEQAQTFRARLVRDFETGMTSKWSYQILDSGDGYMWIASGSGGFIRVRREVLLGKESTVVAESTFNHENSSHTIGNNVALKVAQAQDGSVWGIARDGLYQLSRKDEQGEVKLVTHPTPKPNMTNPYSIHTDADQCFWGETSSTSLYYLNPVRGNGDSIELKQLGMEDKVQMMTICDSLICLLTTRSVTMLNGKAKQLIPIIEQHDNDYRYCYWDDHHRLLWLGGADGCMVIDLPRLLANQQAFRRQAQITEYSLTDNYLSVQFSNGRISEWTVPFTSYYYRLEGVDHAWRPVNHGMNVEYKTLAAGNYSLQLGRRPMYSSETIILDNIPILVPQPWYKTWWFFSLLVIAVFFMVLVFFRHYSLKLQLEVSEADKQELLSQYLAIKEAAIKAVTTDNENARAMADERQNRIERANRRWLEEIKKQVESHLSDADFNVSSLADVSGLNEKALYRRMKALTGKTTIEYIKGLRMQRAAALLLHHEFSINEVMYMVGFTSTSYFSKCFEESYGMTPSEYRAKHNNVV